MSFRATCLFLSLLFAVHVLGQTRTITGKLVSEELHPIYEARIYNEDTILLVTSDTGGNFKTEIPIETRSLIVGSIGMDWRSIDLTADCVHFEIILLNSGTYDFMSAVKVDRLRKK